MLKGGTHGLKSLVDSAFDLIIFTGVVVVDDLQEVTTDDPNFLFESNDGFQEVTSKRTLKIIKQKLEAEQKKTEKEAQKKREHLNKVCLESACIEV